MTRAFGILAMVTAAHVCGCGGDSSAGTAQCPTFVPFGAPPLSLATAQEAHRWRALEARWRVNEARDPGFTRRETAARLARHDDEGPCFGDAYIAGRLLFGHAFSRGDGLGHGEASGEPQGPLDVPFRRVHSGRFGGPDANGCRSCHWRGGQAGAGAVADNAFLLGDGDRISSADARNAPPLHGAGVREALAREMTESLQAQRDEAIARARREGATLSAELVAKGVSFGTLHVASDGTVDARDVEGIDADLVVRPFGWKGNFRSIRDAVEEALQVHHGIQAPGRVLAAEPDTAALGAGAASDPDGDGVEDEITDDQVTALVLFLAAQALPIMRPHERLNDAPAAAPGLRPPTSTIFLEEWTEGRALFDEIGCAHCHVPRMTLESPRFHTVDARGREHAIDLSQEMERPRLAFDSVAERYVVAMFSDLKRHDMGDALASRHMHRGVAERLVMTPPLWGLADSGPWLHDGRRSADLGGGPQSRGPGPRARRRARGRARPQPGATGYTGRAVVSELRERGFEVVAHVRPDSTQLDEWRSRFAQLGFGLESLALVALFLSARQPQLALCDAALEVHLQGDQRVTLGGELAAPLGDLFGVSEELPDAFGRVPGVAPLLVGSDVHLVQEELVALDHRECTVEVALAVAEALHLGAQEHHAHLELVFDVVRLGCLGISADQHLHADDALFDTLFCHARVYSDSADASTGGVGAAPCWLKRRTNARPS